MYKISPKKTILKFWTTFSEKGYFGSNAEKNEHHYRIACIEISLNIKFPIKPIILFGQNSFKFG